MIHPTSEYMTNFETIELKYNNPVESVATLVFNRPESLNAINLKVLQELGVAVSDLEINKNNIRALVVTGAGDKAFVAGADITQMVSMTPPEARNYLMTIQQLLNRIEQLPFPVIAKIDGYALGGGLEIALACDIRVASSNSVVGLPEVSLGLIPAGGGTQRLSRLIGQSNAKYLILTAKQLKAEEAKQLGILNEVVTKEELDEATLKLLRTVMKMGPIALNAAKRSIEASFNESLNSGLEIELTNAVSCFQSEDLREGMKAFIERRTAEFKGH